MQMKIFRFATSHYISVMQRAYDKEWHLPQMVKYLKAHINYSVECAQWLLKQFLNFDVLKECLLENCEKSMRSFLTGIIYCAML